MNTDDCDSTAFVHQKKYEIQKLIRYK